MKKREKEQRERSDEDWQRGKEDEITQKKQERWDIKVDISIEKKAIEWKLRQATGRTRVMSGKTSHSPTPYTIIHYHQVMMNGDRTTKHEDL